MKKVLAKCLKTYPDEDDMRNYCNGKINDPCDVKIFRKGRKYFVDEKHYNKNYFEVIEPKVSNSLLDLDGKTIPVTFHVSKFEPKIDIDLSNDR